MKKTTKTIKPNIEEVLKKLDNNEERMHEINAALHNNNFSEATDFIMRFAVSKDCQKMAQILSRISEQPQTFKRETEFDTLYHVALIDGERQLFKKFMQLITDASEGDRYKVESQLTRVPF